MVGWLVDKFDYSKNDIGEMIKAKAKSEPLVSAKERITETCSLFIWIACTVCTLYTVGAMYVRKKSNRACRSTITVWYQFGNIFSEPLLLLLLLLLLLCEALFKAAK